MNALLLSSSERADTCCVKLLCGPTVLVELRIWFLALRLSSDALTSNRRLDVLLGLFPLKRIYPLRIPDRSVIRSLPDACFEAAASVVVLERDYVGFKEDGVPVAFTSERYFAPLLMLAALQ